MNSPVSEHPQGDSNGKILHEHKNSGQVRLHSSRVEVISSASGMCMIQMANS